MRDLSVLKYLDNEVGSDLSDLFGVGRMAQGPSSTPTRRNRTTSDKEGEAPSSGTGTSCTYLSCQQKGVVVVTVGCCSRDGMLLS